MSGTVDTLAVEGLCLTLTEAGVFTTADVGLIRAPGAWIRHTGVSFDRLGGFTHLTEIHLIVPDNGYLRSRNELLTALNTVLTVLDPDADPVFRGLLPPGGHTLPGLVVPFNLPSDYRHETQE